MEKLELLLKSAILRQQVAAFILAAGALFKFTFDFDVSATVEAIFLGLAAFIPILTFVTRIFKPAPNLSDTAEKKEIELVAEGKIPPSPTGPATPVKKQGGFARPLMLALLLALAIPCVVVLHGCGTLSGVENPTFDDHLKDLTDKASLTVQTVNAALNAKLISSETAIAFRAMADTTRDVLHNAQSLRGTDLKSAEGQLQIAEATLTNLQQYLLERGAK